MAKAVRIRQIRPLSMCTVRMCNEEATHFTMAREASGNSYTLYRCTKHLPARTTTRKLFEPLS